MDVELLRQSVEHAGLAAAGVAFLAGLVFSFNPVALASISCLPRVCDARTR